MQLTFWSGPTCSSTRRFEHRAIALAAAKQFRAGLDRLLDPVVEALRFLLVDHRADEGLFVLGIAGDQFPGGGDEALAELVVDVGMHEDALDADAALPGLVEGAEDDALDDRVETVALVGFDDAGGIAAEFEHDLLLAGLGLEIPADRRRAGEATAA